MTTQANKQLQTFPSPSPQRDFCIHFEIPEFTCLCPMTGQPDFAQIFIDYVPDKKCVELKSLKLYMWSYRNEGAFHEKVTNQILDDIVTALSPRWIRVKAKFNVRGGIYTDVIVAYHQPNWSPSKLLGMSIVPPEHLHLVSPDPSLEQ